MNNGRRTADIIWRFVVWCFVAYAHYLNRHVIIYVQNIMRALNFVCLWGDKITRRYRRL